MVGFSFCYFSGFGCFLLGVLIVILVLVLLWLLCFGCLFGLSCVLAFVV